MNRVETLITKYKELTFYVVFGALTTLINFAAYFLFYKLLKASNGLSTVIAWFFAVTFAYFTNKLYVFKSKSFGFGVLKDEIISFLGARVATGLLDVVIMYLAVDVLAGNASVWKLISNLIVIITNYVASKLLVFKKK